MSDPAYNVRATLWPASVMPALGRPTVFRTNAEPPQLSKLEWTPTAITEQSWKGICIPHFHSVLGDGWCLPDSEELIRVVITLGKALTLADDLLAIDALLFLASCLLSYAAPRARSIHRMHRIECTADTIFIFAIAVMALICGFITYAMLISPGAGH